MTAPPVARLDAVGRTGTSRSPWLLAAALTGFVVPNGFFIYWLVREWNGLAAVMADHLAVAFVLDAFMAMGLLAWSFARRPIGPVRWPWFVVLSLLGGLAFSLPMYWWLNASPTPRD